MCFAILGFLLLSTAMVVTPVAADAALDDACAEVAEALADYADTGADFRGYGNECQESDCDSIQADAEVDTCSAVCCIIVPASAGAGSTASSNADNAVAATVGINAACAGASQVPGNTACTGLGPASPSPSFGRRLQSADSGAGAQCFSVCSSWAGEQATAAGVFLACRQAVLSHVAVAFSLAFWPAMPSALHVGKCALRDIKARRHAMVHRAHVCIECRLIPRQSQLYACN